MEKITKNGKEYLRFKIGDQFEAISGKGSFNKMKKEGLASDCYDEEKGFVYPFYDNSTSNNHIKGYCKNYNVDGNVIKICNRGSAGHSVFLKNKSWITNIIALSSILNLTNEFVSLLFTKISKKWIQGSTIPAIDWGNIRNEFIEIPANHQELSKVIARVLEYKQLSNQLSKQFKDYKQAILQEANKAIEIHKQNGDHDKYISFKIGDEFQMKSSRKLFTESNLQSVWKGDITFNSFKKAGFTCDEKKDDFKFKFMDSSTKNNHVKGYSKISNFKGRAIKVSESGEKAGQTVILNGEYFIGRPAYILINDNLTNEFLSIYLSEKIPKYKQTSAISNIMYGQIKNTTISLPLSHNLLANKIKQINHWETIVNQTTKQMETYIDGVLQMSLK